ncbi:hypothetical protein GCM10009839_08720 [Catenulispora yoronensis]|uniref:PRC-barrel domain-containing protein n=1 Tax=Catenulispora yoronensis TaxID=450799 RepID=A0ABP5F6M6_9ACTN
MQDTLEYVIGTRVRCAADDSASADVAEVDNNLGLAQTVECGVVDFIVVDPVVGRITHLVVRPDEPGAASRLVPVHIAVPGPDGGTIDLNCTRARFEEFEAAVQTRFLPGAATPLPGRERVLEWPFFGLALTPAVAGAAPGADPQPATTVVERIPVGEVGVRRGERVHATDGEIGRVQGLVVVSPDSAVTHVLLDEGHLWGRKRVAIPIRDVSGIDEDGVAVRLSKDEIKDLPPVDVEGVDSGE